MSKKSLFTLSNLKLAFDKTTSLLATISYTRMTLLSVAVLGSYGENKLKEDAITQKQATEVFGVSKSYVSQCIKVARYILDNDLVDIVAVNAERFDLAKMYKALSEVESVEEFIEYFDLKRPTVEAEDEADDNDNEAEDEAEDEADDNDNEVEVEAEVEADDDGLTRIELKNGDVYYVDTQDLVTWLENSGYVKSGQTVK